MIFLSVLLPLAACIPDPGSVFMTGTVYDAPNAVGSVVGEVSVRGLDGDGTTVDEQISDEGGAFTLELPAAAAFYVQTEGPTGQGYIPTAFSGQTGLDDFDAGMGFPWIASPEWFTTMQSDWAGCPGAEAAGTAGSGVVVVGEVRLWLNIADIDDMPLTPDALIRVSPAQGDEVEACYHDSDGLYDSGATGTGTDGLFAVFGVASGGLAVSIEYTDTTETRRVVIYQYMAEDGGLVPIYPTFVYDGG